MLDPSSWTITTGDIIPSPASLPQLPEMPPEIILPVYIRPVPKQMHGDDVAYLRKKGAFDIPEPILLNELLRLYIQWVHPFLPIIDIPDFLDTTDKNDPGDQVSLMLFQAVICAAATFIEMRHLAGYPYQNRRAARKAFFDKVKVLYDSEYEDDRVTIVQTTLLMSYFYERSNQPKDIWHWSGIAIATALSVGMNGEPHHGSTSLQQRRLWKRIWHSCIMRDRLISAGMRRTMRIREGHCHLPTLRVEDFEACNSISKFHNMIGSVYEYSSTPSILVKLCIALTDLCRVIADSHNVQYSEPTQMVGGSQDATAKLLPRNPPPPPDDFDRCDRDLQKWYEELPVELRHHFGDESEGMECEVDRVVYLHRALLMGIYLATKSTLHRPRCMPGMKSTAETWDDSKEKAHDAAGKICDIYGDLFAKNLMAFVPNTGVAMLLPACIVLLTDIQSAKSPTHGSSKRRLETGANALERLREMYASSDFAVGVLQEAVRKIAPQIASSQPTIRGALETEAKQDPVQDVPVSSPIDEPGVAASMLVFSSTLAPNEKQLLHSWASEPPNVDLNSVMMGATSAHFLDPEDAFDNEPYLDHYDRLITTTPHLDWYELESLINFG